MEILDSYQYYLCTIAEEFQKGTPLRRRYTDMRVITANFVMEAMVAIESCKVDPTNGMRNLNRIIRKMGEFHDSVVKELFPGKGASSISVRRNQEPLNDLIDADKDVIFDITVSPLRDDLKDPSPLSSSIPTRYITRALEIAGLTTKEVRSFVKELDL